MKRVIDMHVHVGVLGDDSEYARWGRTSSWMRTQVTFHVFLLYARIPPHQLSDKALEEATLRLVRETGVDGVVCLALDPVFDDAGRRREELSHFWVSNEYVLELRKKVGGEKLLFGASVHPLDPDFEARVARYAAEGAALIKWLPSAQQIDLADERVGKALLSLARPRVDAHGRERVLPLLLHVGAEYAIETTNPRTKSYDFLSWSRMDAVRNFFRRRKWARPEVDRALGHLRAARDAGAVIILAHCGLPYFASTTVTRWLEHSDQDIVAALVREPASPNGGRFYADVSACCTPFRRRYFDAIRKLPEDRLLMGSDFPVPVFEMEGETMRDLAAVLSGETDRVLVPEDNLLDVNERTLRRFFPAHPMFTNFGTLAPDATVE